MFGNGFAVDFLFLAIHLEPLKEIVVAGRPCAEACLQSVAEYANLVESEDIGDILAIREEVLVVCLFHFDGGFLEFDKDNGQAVDKE